MSQHHDLLRILYLPYKEVDSCRWQLIYLLKTSQICKILENISGDFFVFRDPFKEESLLSVCGFNERVFTVTILGNFLYHMDRNTNV